MNDKALFALIRSTLLPQFALYPETAGVQLARSFQPRQAGTPSGAALFFFKVGDKRYGWPKRFDLFNEAGEVFDHELRQQYETTIQFDAWVPQDPAQATAPTESDVLNTVSGIIQSDTVVQAFRAAGVGLQRVTEVRNPFVVDDRDRFEAVPSFDIVVTHFRVLAATVPTVVTYDANIHRV